VLRERIDGDILSNLRAGELTRPKFLPQLRDESRLVKQALELNAAYHEQVKWLAGGTPAPHFPSTVSQKFNSGIIVVTNKPGG